MEMNNETTNTPTWIWYPGDYEIWLGNEMNNRRTERGAFFPPFWKTDSHYAMVEFSKRISLEETEEIDIAVEGRYHLKLDGRLQFGSPKRLLLPAGEHHLAVKVYNQATPPALYISGKTVNTNGSWQVTSEDREWIDESGKVSDTPATVYREAGYWDFHTADRRPSAFRLPLQRLMAKETTTVENGRLVNFGKELFGYPCLHGLKGEGVLNLYYGESPAEAMDTACCETLDRLYVRPGSVTDLALDETRPFDGEYTLTGAKAFRYIYVEIPASVTLDRVDIHYEYLPVRYPGFFVCNDGELNRIWHISTRTLHMTTREFFIDGIKRDRWVWSGDAIQSYLMNYYLFFETEAVKRTIRLLRGKDPVTAHVNTIMDYTFYWFMSIYDYYLYTGDKHFVTQIYPHTQTMMDYVLGRTNANGMVEGLPGDWVFIDWADGVLDKKGEVAFEQILFCKSLETMALCAGLADDKDGAEAYTKRADELRGKLWPAFWDESKQALAHNRVDGKRSDTVTRYANIFAIRFDYADASAKEAIRDTVLLNDDIRKITTPYMRFYELDALCLLGEYDRVMKEIKAYWGGMLEQGATTFWEKYDPNDTGEEHLAMYGRPYGKSLCHAWGASPLYLLGKYFLGVRPVKPGYGEFVVEPVLGGLEWMEGDVPTPYGKIQLYMDRETINVSTPGGSGYIIFTSRSEPLSNAGRIESLGEGKYRLRITPALSRAEDEENVICISYT
jgi:hypothetical protein